MIGRTVWGIDLAPMYASTGTIGAEAEGATVVDVPCGGGVALRGVKPGQSINLVVIDIDQKMLARTTARADVRGIYGITTIEADMRELPLDDASVDLLCTFSGLHMIDAPHRAVVEFGRVVKPGGRLIGSSFTGDGSRRQRRLFAAGERRGLAKAPADGATIASWLNAAGFQDVDTRGRGFAVFEARRSPV
ncbi:MAG: methyltransferase domain-containing protein [Solirubrobacterales bacterium]